MSQRKGKKQTSKSWSVTIGLFSALVVAIIGISLWLIPQIDLDNLPGAKRNPDKDRNIYELIESRGFKSEAHFVTTESGYILQLARIVNPYVKERSKLKPVLLHHGFQCTGTLWLVASNGTLDKDGHYYEYDEKNQRIDTRNMVGNTLGFVLASQGYDVWLANYRGSIYSSNHTTLNTDEAEFWRFSVNEMIDEDIPAEIAYIQKVTGKKSIGYIGHSQGSFMMFCLLSKRQELSEVIKPFIPVSPVVFFREPQSLFGKFLSLFKAHLSNTPKRVPDRLDFRETHSKFCDNIYTNLPCKLLFYYLFRGTEKNFDMNRLGVYFAHMLTGSSAWNMAHFQQLLERSDQPRHFDFGKEMNLVKYGNEIPPIYDISKITSKHIALIYAAHDWLNHMDTIEKLKTTLKVKLLDDYQVPDLSFNHMELVMGKRVGVQVNSKILEILARY